MGELGVRIGFTGTQVGMTALQRKSVLALCTQCTRILEAHHGDCIGADEEFHQLIRAFQPGVPVTPAEAQLARAVDQWYRQRRGNRDRRSHPQTIIHIHPPELEVKRAFCRGGKTYIHKAQPYLVRNRAIVDATDWLIACPKSEVPQMRSGTWSTVRYAIQRHHDVYMVFPDGRVKLRNSAGEKMLNLR